MSDDESVSTQEENTIVKEIVQTILMLDYSKKPFKQSDITSHLSQKPGRKVLKESLEKAKNGLISLGLELVETKDTSVKAFFVISKQRPLQFMYKYATEEEVANRILLTLVLAYIFMKNGTVESEELFNHLKSLKIYNNGDVTHPYFGNIKKKVMHEFVEQLYLSVTKIPDSNMHEITWGQRAELEITKRSILEFVCQCGFEGKMKPQNLASHYEKAIREETKQSGNGNSGTEVLID